MTDGGRREDLKYRSAARHRAASPRKDTQTKMERKESRHGAMLWMAEKLNSEECEKALALWGRKGESGVRG